MQRAVRVHYAAPEAEIEKYLAIGADVVTHDRRRRSRQFPARLAPARREGKHFANGGRRRVALRIRRRPLPALHG